MDRPHLIVTENYAQFAFSELVTGLGEPGQEARVLDVARALVRRSAISFALVTVNSPGTSELRDRDELAAALVEADIAGTSVVLHGDDVAATIGAYLDGLANPLMCMASHGRGPIAALVLGSPSEELLTHTSHPVLLVGPKARAITTLSRTLVACLDGSDVSEHVLSAALAWAASFGGDVLVVRHVSDDASAADALAAPQQLFRAVEWLRFRGIAARPELIEGRSTAVAICEAARRVGVSAVAMTTRARPPLRRMTFGSVALDVLRNVSRPVLLVNPSAG